MSEKPIIVSGAGLIRAIWEGRKTQARRVIKPQPWHHCEQWIWTRKGPGVFPRPVGNVDGAVWWDGVRFPILSMQHFCPYRPGDRLWVREAWQLIRECGHHEDGVWWETWRQPIPKALPKGWLVDYGAAPFIDDGPWRPSIHMPRWASRLTLDVLDVRVERLQDISEEDAKAEGARCPGIVTANWNSIMSYVDGFALLWDSFNAKRDFGWDVNPWVWVIEFRKVDEV